MNDLISIGSAIRAKGVEPKVIPDTLGQFSAFIHRGEARPTAQASKPVSVITPTATSQDTQKPTQVQSAPKVVSDTPKAVETAPVAKNQAPARKGCKTKEVTK